MTKRVLFFFFLMCSCRISYGQTWDEWFRQKKTQRKYLVEQIVKLQIYIGYVRKGYAIVDQGLHMIGKIKDGDFNLHSDFFNRLASVNPVVRKYPKVAEIMRFQERIVSTCRKSKMRVTSEAGFSATEISYVAKVHASLTGESMADLDELSELTTNAALEMSDVERIARLDKLHSKLENRYWFIISFCEQVAVLATQRAAELQQIQKLKSLYE
jgi:hypothetical protein